MTKPFTTKGSVKELGCILAVWPDFAASYNIGQTTFPIATVMRAITSYMTVRVLHLSILSQCTCPAETSVDAASIQTVCDVPVGLLQCNLSVQLAFPCVVHMSVFGLRFYVQSHSYDRHVHVTTSCSACALVQACPTMSSIQQVFTV